MQNQGSEEMASLTEQKFLGPDAAVISPADIDEFQWEAEEEVAREFFGFDGPSFN